MVIHRALHRISPRRAKQWEGFTQNYKESDRYDNAQLMATIFWIFSAVGHIYFDPVRIFAGDQWLWLNENFVQVISGSFALLTLVAIYPSYHYWKEKPFTFTMEWYPLAHKTRTHKEKRRNNLGLVREGKIKIVTSTEVIGGQDSYQFDLQTSDPDTIKFKVDDYNADQSPNRDRTRLNCNEITHREFLNVFIVEKDGELDGGTDHHVKIVDIDDDENERTEVLSLEVRE